MSPRRRRGSLARAAVRLARLLGSDECVLIGGLAVGVHGYVRATDDLDFISRQPLRATRERLEAAGIATRLLRGDILDGGFDCLKGEIDGIPFDVLPPLVPVRWEAALTLRMGGGTLRVVDLDALLQLKMRARGTHDLLDAAQLVLRHPGTEERARELATAYRVRDQLDSWLRDPRILAQLEEEERAARRRTSGRGRRATPSLSARARGGRPRGPRAGAAAPHRGGRPGPRPRSGR